MIIDGDTVITSRIPGSSLVSAIWRGCSSILFSSHPQTDLNRPAGGHFSIISMDRNYKVGRESYLFWDSFGQPPFLFHLTVKALQSFDCLLQAGHLLA